jgi:hypothetical protein
MNEVFTMPETSFENNNNYLSIPNKERENRISIFDLNTLKNVLRFVVDKKYWIVPAIFLITFIHDILSREKGFTYSYKRTIIQLSITGLLLIIMIYLVLYCQKKNGIIKKRYLDFKGNSFTLK